MPKRAGELRSSLKRRTAAKRLIRPWEIREKARRWHRAHKKSQLYGLDLEIAIIKREIKRTNEAIQQQEELTPFKPRKRGKGISERLGELEFDLEQYSRLYSIEGYLDFLKENLAALNRLKKGRQRAVREAQKLMRDAVREGYRAQLLSEIKRLEEAGAQ